MSNISISSATPIEAEQEPLINHLFEEMQHLNEQMRSNQDDIERLKLETRMISKHSDQLLLQIEAQLDALRKGS